MTVILVVLTICAFLLIEHVLQRGREREVSHVGASLQRALEEEAVPQTAAGIRLPAPLYYHQGHAWVHWVSPDQAYVGLDDFGRRLLGKRAEVELPAVGTNLRQGKDSVAIRRNGDEAQLLVPISGEVVEVNPELTRDPGLVHEDSYARGWLYKIRSPELFKELPNLLRGTLAVRWMEDTFARFQHRMMLASGSVIQDGGGLVEDVSEQLDHDQWCRLVEEFMLTTPRQHG
jgi:glycine cleavage system H protein